MPYLVHCHECDKPTANRFGVCDNCIERTTADEYNDEVREERGGWRERIVFEKLKRDKKKRRV